MVYVGGQRYCGHALRMQVGRAAERWRIENTEIDKSKRRASYNNLCIIALTVYLQSLVLSTSPFSILSLHSKKNSNSRLFLQVLSLKKPPDILLFTTSPSFSLSPKNLMSWLRDEKLITSKMIPPWSNRMIHLVHHSSGMVISFSIKLFNLSIFCDRQ